LKKLSIASASALALGLALSSLPAQAQKPTASASTPGGGGGIQAQATTIPTAIKTIQLVEDIVSGSKAGANTNVQSIGSLPAPNYRLEPTGQTYSGPVRLCMKYNAGTTSANSAGNKLSSALKSVLSQVKDQSGKATYKAVTGTPEDDKINSQMCMQLKSF
jgi:hypothetical protein